MVKGGAEAKPSTPKVGVPESGSARRRVPVRIGCADFGGRCADFGGGCASNAGGSQGRVCAGNGRFGRGTGGRNLVSQLLTKNATQPTSNPEGGETIERVPKGVVKQPGASSGRLGNCGTHAVKGEPAVTRGAN